MSKYTGIEKEVEICATKVTNKTSFTHVGASSQFLLCNSLLLPLNSCVNLTEVVQ
jgi:hypothetical protein